MHVIIFDPGDPSLLLACCLYSCSRPAFCSIAAITVARLLPLLLFACLAQVFGGFVEWLVVEGDSLVTLHLIIF